MTEYLENDNNPSNSIIIKELENFKWMTLKFHLLPLLMQETDFFMEKFISKFLFLLLLL